MSTKTASPLGVVGKLMRTPGLATRAGTGALIGGAGGAAVGGLQGGEGGAIRGAVGGALGGAIGGAASSRLFRRNIGRAVAGKGAIKTRAIKPSGPGFRAINKSNRERTSMALVKGNITQAEADKVLLKDKKVRKLVEGQRALKTQQARAASAEAAKTVATRQRAAVAGKPATGKGPMPMGIGAPKAPRGQQLGRSMGGATYRAGRVAGTVLSAPGKAWGAVRRGAGQVRSNFSRGFAEAAQGR